MLKESSFIGITMGDPAGIGPEIAVKAAEYFIKINTPIKPVIFGSFEHIDYVLKNIIKKDAPINLIRQDSLLEYSYKNTHLNVIDLSSKSYQSVKYGEINPEYAKDVESFISAAVDFSLDGRISGFATAPINKEMMIKGGAKFGGHTELLGYLTSSKDYAMLFYSKTMITVLATIHIPLFMVSRSITKESLRNILKISISSMINDFGISSPKIAVLGLNPHAGENGEIGAEEKDIISPVITEFKNNGFFVSGPFPSDSFFAKIYKNYDLIVSMYHDQALIPFKLLSFNEGVNVTAGLKIVRTSPVHGTAYNIAGKNLADSNSMKESIKLAYEISKNRLKWKEK